MKKITEDLELCKFDGVSCTAVYVGGMTSLYPATIKWRKVEEGEFGEIEVLKLSEIVEQLEEKNVPIITVIIDSPMYGKILQYGNYPDDCWYEIGQTCGYA